MISNYFKMIEIREPRGTIIGIDNDGFYIGSLGQKIYRKYVPLYKI